MAGFQARPGDVVRLTASWGAHSRNKCAVCTRYMAGGAAPRCSSCGTGYQRVSESSYEVLSG